MTIADIVSRGKPEEHFHGDYKIPWHERSFSKRLLDEHLDQTHDAASRPFELIDKHVQWIHEYVLESRPSLILDLCCGPGFYVSRLTELGHDCTGIDFSPSSLAYARAETADRGLSCKYRQGDVRTAEYGPGYDLVMMIFAEFSAFAPHEAQDLLKKMNAALHPGGKLVLEPQRFDSLQNHGSEPVFWARQQTGLFSDQPHLYLEEHFWDEERRVLTDRYYVVDAATGDATEYVNTRQAYTHAELTALLDSAGFEAIEFHASLSGSEEAADEDCFAVVANKHNG
jgi:SAM-dependent methyltransferase